MRGELSISQHFKALKDPRTGNATLHELLDIVTIALCATICGANEWTDVEEFGKTHETWLRAFLVLPNGIPSHDTFGRVFARLDPHAFEACLRRWVEASVKTLTQRQVSLDGKVLRNSHDRYRDQEALQTVSAWLVETGLVLGHLKVAGNTNEITTVREMLMTLDLAGCVVTADALHTQTQTARLIVERGSDYVLPVKDNQERLHERIASVFVHESARAQPFKAVTHTTAQTTNKTHGRIETRRCTVIDDPSYLNEINHQGQWWHLSSIVRLERSRTQDGHTSHETHYFISSLAEPAKAMLQFIRAHWQIENGLHWKLDVVFHEDHTRIRVDHAPENMAVLRRFALNLLGQEKSYKRGLQAKRLKAAWDDDYLLKVLQGVRV